MAREIQEIEQEVIACRACPRLVAHLEEIAQRKTRRFADQAYWGKPVPAFGAPEARLLIVGLAPAAHGANRTGRMFTGDRSGEWLFEALHRYGFANQASSTGIDDGLALNDVLISAVARCAPPGNKPDKVELANCRGYLVREIEALANLRAVLALGKIAMDGFLAAWSEGGGEIPRPKPKFGHGERYELDGQLDLLVSYHPSQQNTFTGRLTRPMFHQVFDSARQILDAHEP